MPQESNGLWLSPDWHHTGDRRRESDDLAALLLFLLCCVSIAPSSWTTITIIYKLLCSCMHFTAFCLSCGLFVIWPSAKKKIATDSLNCAFWQQVRASCGTKQFVVPVFYRLSDSSRVVCMYSLSCPPLSPWFPPYLHKLVHNFVSALATWHLHYGQWEL